MDGALVGAAAADEVGAPVSAAIGGGGGGDDVSSGAALTGLVTSAAVVSPLVGVEGIVGRVSAIIVAARVMLPPMSTAPSGILGPRTARDGRDAGSMGA